MSTNKITLASSQEFMTGYTPIYQPIYPLFLAKGQQYESEVGTVDFRNLKTVGDVRAKRITPKDTEIKQVQVTDDKKTFKKYFSATQFTQSLVQSREGADDVVTMVLDEHQAQYDDLFMFGDGGLNNGLFTSSDVNYVLKSSAAVTFANRLDDLFTKIVTTVEEASKLAGQKVVFIYGADLITVYNGKFSGSDKPFAQVLKEALPADVEIVKVPSDVTPAGQNGWVVANIDHTKLHYTKLPELLSQGYNDEKMYYWHNFMLGSCMLEVKAKGGVIRQPVTLPIS